MLVPSFRLTIFCYIFWMVLSGKPSYLNRENGFTVWYPGSIRYSFRGRRKTVITLGYFNAVYAFTWHSLPPACPSLSPLQRVIVSDGERNNIRILVPPILFFPELVGDPLGLRSE